MIEYVATKEVLMEDAKIFISIFLSVNISVLTGFLIYKLWERVKREKKQQRVNHFGDSAETKVISYIEKYFTKYKILKDLYLKTNNGLTEIDVLLLCERGIFIIEIKSHNGYIITRGKHWTQRWGDKVVRFYNPTYQNKAHRIALENILKKRQSLASLPIYTVTVFTSSKVSFSENVKDVIKLPVLAKFIKSKPCNKRMNHSTIASLERLIKSYRETSRRRQNQHKKKIWESNRKKRAYKVNEHSVK
jgi:hypothetical protein